LNIAPTFRRARLAPAKSLALAMALLATSCASTPGPGAETSGQSGDVRYPRRAAGCELTMYETAVPGVAAWDDLGVAEIACHIDSPVAECVRRLKAEACRLGGDLLYNVPRKPLRPRDQVLIYRGQVAHTRNSAPRKPEDPDMPPAASVEESAGPVVPLPSGDPPVVPASPGAAP
jgi:hypothetical protein